MRRRLLPGASSTGATLRFRPSWVSPGSSLGALMRMNGSGFSQRPGPVPDAGDQPLRHGGDGRAAAGPACPGRARLAMPVPGVARAVQRVFRQPDVLAGTLVPL